MSKIYPGLVHLNGHLLAAVDVETTGTRPDYHEIVQIAVVPLDSDIWPLDGVSPFYTTMRPLYPERADLRSMNVHGIKLGELLEHAPDPGRVADLFLEWFQALDLPSGKRLVPMAHNWPFEAGFLEAWLGHEAFEEVFHGHPRDAMVYALALNDRAAFAGRPQPFPVVGLKAMSLALGISHERHHDALADCLAEAEVYRAMLVKDLF